MPIILRQLSGVTVRAIIHSTTFSLCWSIGGKEPGWRRFICSAEETVPTVGHHLKQTKGLNICVMYPQRDSEGLDPPHISQSIMNDAGPF